LKSNIIVADKYIKICSICFI